MEAGVGSCISEDEVTSVLHPGPEGVEAGESLMGGGELQQGVAAEDEVVLERDGSLYRERKDVSQQGTNLQAAAV